MDRRVGSYRRERTDRPLLAVDLFAGCGGLTLGLKQAGFKKVKNMKGGILAWSDKVDPRVPKY